MTDSSESLAVRFENVSFRYSEQSEWIIKDINFSITSGEWVTIVGGNGSGKSTLIKIMNGLLKPSLGRVYVLGENIEMENLLKIRKCVGVIFQNPDEQIVGITVEEDIAFGLQNLMFQRNEIISRVDHVMSLLKLEEFRNRPVRTLSGGQKQLVAIAGILVMHPKIIVFDEAASMLDPQNTANLHSLMSDLHRKGFTVIQVTHDPEDILRADRVLVLNQGRLAFEGDVPTLMKQSEILEDAHTLPPFVVRFKKALYRRGIELSGGCKSEKELAKSIWEYISVM
ncbi:energy-coupling factor transport system ATP-binding protein [Paenibacillus uliginis N3/975]|uniref:Energy-coupling factor transport system ATP-binding protein n=1 Tax=Paenibacillus uliginis N3/975 TaxID=1313296 RepID=A0A1X7HT63_9BACL|nr:ATP-binding cassette domain-containing protein [Paenibacillus uliginis]SMF92256.1 energy-coupling factor transport system ATP-binding protein [Paenibacillus uliginis N3/975]